MASFTMEKELCSLSSQGIFVFQIDPMLSSFGLGQIWESEVR